MNYARFFKNVLLSLLVLIVCTQSLDAMQLRSKTVLGTKQPTKPPRARKKKVQAPEIQVQDEKEAKAGSQANDLGPAKPVYDRFFWYLDGKHLENADSISKSDCYNLLAHVSGQLFLTSHIALQSNFDDGSFFTWFRPQSDSIYQTCRALYYQIHPDEPEMDNPSYGLVYKYDLLRVFSKIDQQLRISPEQFSVVQAQKTMVEALCVMHEVLIKIVRKPLYLYDYSLDDQGEINEDEEIDEDDQKLIGGVWRNPIPSAMTQTVRMAYRNFIKFIRTSEVSHAIDVQDLSFDVITPMMFIIRDMLVKIFAPDFCGGVYRFGWGSQPTQFITMHTYLFQQALDAESHGMLENGLNSFSSQMRAAKTSAFQETPVEIYKNTIRLFAQANMISACTRTTLPTYIDEDSYRHQNNNALLADASSKIIPWIIISDQTGESVTALLERGVQVRIEDIQTVLEKPLAELRAVRALLFQRVLHKKIIQAMSNSIMRDARLTDHMLQQLIDFIPEQEQLFDFIVNLLNCTGVRVKEILNSSNSVVRAKIYPDMKRSDKDPVTLLGRVVENIIQRNKAKVDAKDGNKNVYVDANMLIFLLNNNVKYVPSGDNKQFETMSTKDADNEMWKKLFESSTYRCQCLTHPNYIDCILMRVLMADQLIGYLEYLYEKYGAKVETIFMNNGVSNQDIDMRKVRQDRGGQVLTQLIERIKERNKKFVEDEKQCRATANEDNLIKKLYDQNLLQDKAAACDAFLASLLMRMGIMTVVADASGSLLEYHKLVIAELQKEFDASGTHYLWSIVKKAQETMEHRAEQIGYTQY